MERIRGFYRRLDLFDALSLGLIAVLFILALVHLSRFPLFKDIYYHMGTTEAFGSAGGVSLFDFWEYAPAGRPHLYPPLLHIIMYVMNLTGLPMGTVGTIVSFSAFHLILLSTWYGVRRLFSSRAAFYTTVVLCSSFMFFWGSAVTSAASLVLILTPFIFIALENDRNVSACVLLALALYTHLVLGHLIAFAVLIYAVHRRSNLKSVLLVLFGAYLLWLPWGIHLLLNYGTLDLSSPMGGGASVTLHLLLWAVAIAGFIYCYFKKGRYYILPSLLLAMIPILFFYPHRFWEGHVFVPLAMLGGVALSGLHGYLKERATQYMGGRQAYKVLVLAFMAVPVVLILLVDPIFETGRGPGRTGGAGGRPEVRSGARPLLDGQSLPPGDTQPPGKLITYDREEPPETGDISPGSLGEEPKGATRDEVENEPRSFPDHRTATPETDGSTGYPPMGMDDRPPLDEMRPNNGPLKAKASTLLYLVAGGTGQDRMHNLTEEPMLNEDTEALAVMVEENSDEGQVVFTPDGSLGNLITGLTGRPSTGGMFREVQSEGNNGGMGNGMGSGMDSAYLLVLPEEVEKMASLTEIVPLVTSGGSRRGVPGMEGIDLDSLEYVGTADRYSLYLNPENADVRTAGPGTVIPWVLVFGLLGLALAVVVFDWVRPIHPFRRRLQAGAEPSGAHNAGVGEWRQP